MTGRDGVWIFVTVVPLVLFNGWLDERGYREYLWTPVAAAALILFEGLIRQRFTPGRLWVLPAVMLAIGGFLFWVD